MEDPEADSYNEQVELMEEEHLSQVQDTQEEWELYILEEQEHGIHNRDIGHSDH